MGSSDSRRSSFEVPPRPTPRERYTTRVAVTEQPGTWPTVHVEVLDGDVVAASYDRNYSMLNTFEPFRQGDRMYALVSPHYTATSVLDLQTGQIIASEEPNAGGFCPAGFYVPDWWDLHDGRTLPGSTHWRPVDDEWPTGDFGYLRLATNSNLNPTEFIRCSSSQGRRRVQFAIEVQHDLATGSAIPDDEF